VDTWPKSRHQLPATMDYDPRDGRTYMHLKGEPLYPFGFGLSYTTFKYASAKVSTSQLPANGQIVVSVDFTNSGTRAGDEVVQLYVKHSGCESGVAQRRTEGLPKSQFAAGRNNDRTIAASRQVAGLL
jgi:beta-glucosidase